MENKITEIRKKLLLTQDELADKLGISRELVNKMENGKTAISHKTLALISELLKNDEVNNNSHILHESDAEYGNQLNKESEGNVTYTIIGDLAKSNLTISEANKILANSNKDLIDLYKLQITINSGAVQKNPQHISELLSPFLEKMAKAGVPDMWQTVDDGIVKLGKLLVADVLVMQ